MKNAYKSNTTHIFKTKNIKSIHKKNQKTNQIQLQLPVIVWYCYSFNHKLIYYILLLTQGMQQYKKERKRKKEEESWICL